MTDLLWRKRSTRRTVAINSVGYDKCEPRTMLAGDIAIGNANSGIAISDSAVGDGYILFSEPQVQGRFGGIAADNAEHFVAVRISGAQWQFNDDSGWNDFDPVASDLLVAEVNFSSDRIAPLEGVFDDIGGIDAGYIDADLWFTANYFAGATDSGEIGVHGTSLERDDSLNQLTESEEKIRGIGNAVLEYTDLHDRVPRHAIYSSLGVPLLSWRVEVLPYLGYSDLYSQFNLDEPWNSPHNFSLLDQMPDVFGTPYASQPNTTTFVGMIGDETAFPEGVEPQLRTNDFTDGLSQTVLLVEAAASSAVEWTKPKDVIFLSGIPLAGISSTEKDAFAMFTAGGESFSVSHEVLGGAFQYAFTINDGVPVNFGSMGVALDPAESMRQILNATYDYESRFRSLPAHAIYSDSGQPLLSWRVAILPELGYKTLYDRFRLDEPWDSSFNSQFISQMPHIFAHESLSGGLTSYLAVSGPGTAFPIEDSGTRFGSYNDVADSIAFVLADVDQAVEWSRPQDLFFDAANPTDGLGQIEPGGFHAAFLGSPTTYFGGGPHFVPNNFDPASVASMMLINDGQAVDRSSFLLISKPSEQLSALGLATANHESAYMKFPAHAIYSADQSTPLLSWRVSILPFLGYNHLYQQFHLDEAWDSPHNLSLLPLMPEFFAHEDVPHGQTVFMAAMGDNTMFSMGPDGKSYNDIRDDQHSLMFVEANPNEAVQWTKPADLSFDRANPRKGLDQAGAAGFNTVSAGGGGIGFFGRSLNSLSPKFIPTTISDTAVANLIEINDGNAVDYSFLPAEPSRFESEGLEYSLRTASLAALNYESATQHFPQRAIFDRTTEEPLLSWRVEILPFLGYEALYDQFNLDEPWDSPHNLSLLPMMPLEYFHSDVAGFKTNFLAVVGEDTMFKPDYSRRGGRSFGEVADGSSNTLLFVEADIDRAVEWTRPQDLDFDPGDPMDGIGGDFPGFAFSFADGSAHFFPQSTKAETVSQMVTIADGNIWEYPCYCVELGDTTAIVDGTAGDDTIVIRILPTIVEVDVNGVESTIDRSVFDSIYVDGKSESSRDTINIFDGAGDDQLTAKDGWFLLAGDFDVLGVDFENSFVTSGGGNDSASFEEVTRFVFFSQPSQVTAEFLNSEVGALGYSSITADAELLKEEARIANWSGSNAADTIVVTENSISMTSEPFGNFSQTQIVINGFRRHYLLGEDGADHLEVNIPDLDVLPLDYLVSFDEGRSGQGKVIQVNTDSDLEWLYEGFNSYFVNDLFAFGGAGEYHSGSGNDQFTVHPSSEPLPHPFSHALFGGEGNDSFNVGESVVGQLGLHGQAGDDRYLVEAVSMPAVVILDSIDAEADRLDIVATAGDDVIDVGETTFTINGIDLADPTAAGIETFQLNASDGNDTFNIGSTTRGFYYLGGEGNDIFNIEESSQVDGDFTLVVNGGAGENQLNVNRLFGFGAVPAVVTGSSIFNMVNATIAYSATGGSFSPVDATSGNGGIRLIGTERNDSFLVFDLASRHSLDLYGLGGNDYFRFDESVRGDVFSDGGEGRDRYVFEMTDLATRNFLVDDSGDPLDVDRINAFLTPGDDSISLDGQEIVLVNDRIVFGELIETIEILGGDGNDSFDVGAFNVSNLQIKGQTGRDTFSLDGLIGVGSLILIGESGDDVFNLNSAAPGTFVNAWGFSGKDTFVVSDAFLSDALLDGGVHDDSYDVSFAVGDVRQMQIKDSGGANTDVAVIRSVDDIGELRVLAGGVFSNDQGMFTTHRLESLTLVGTESIDVVRMFAAPVDETIIETGNGNDIVSVYGNLFAEQLTIDLGAGDDVGNVFGTMVDTVTSVMAGVGDDLVNVGATASSNNGSLDQIKGATSVDLGAGEDRIYFNDAISGAPYGYRLSGRRLENIDSLRTRSNFIGVDFAGAETAQLTGNQAANQTTVFASTVTRFVVDGNTGRENTIVPVGEDETPRLVKTGEFSGRFEFDSFRDVAFENFTV